MKKDVKFITEEQALRYMPNTSIENDVLDKVRFTIDNNKFAGNFYSSLWQGGGDGYLYELDEHDDYLVRRQNLKEGERIYRYFTRRSAFTGQVPLIKINIDKGLLYFLKDDDEGLDLIEFETKGIPVRYLNIIPPQNEEYAEGGETEKKVLKYRVTYKKMVDGEYGTSIVYFYNKESAEKFAEEHDTIVEEINDDDLSKIIKKYLYKSGIGRNGTINNNAKEISKKDVVFFISLSKDSETKYLVNDLNTKQSSLPDFVTASYYIYKGNLLKSTYEDTFNKFLGMSIISSNALPDEHKFQLYEYEVKDYEKEQDPRAEKLIGRTVLLQVIENEEGDLMPLVTKINKVVWPSSFYPNPTLKFESSTGVQPYGMYTWGNKFKGEEIDKFLNGEEIKNSEYRGWWTMKLMKEMKKMAEGGSVDVIKKDRYGNDVKIGDAIHIRVLTGRYGQTKDYEGVVSNFDQFGNVELDGQRSLTYTKDYKFDDYEHGHHIWVEKIKEKNIEENLRVPKKYVSTYSGTINGEKFAINGKDKFQEWLDENYPSSVLGAWNTLYNKGWKYKNSTKEYISPENLSYDMIDVYASAEQGQGFSYSLMIPTDKSEYAQGGFMAEGGITDDEGNLIDIKVGDEVVEYKKRFPNAEEKTQIGPKGRIIKIVDAMAKVSYPNDYEEWIALRDLKKMSEGGMMADGGDMDKGDNDKKWNQYVLENRSWFDDETNEDSLKDEIILVTRRHGNTSEEEVGQMDIDEAKNIIKKVIAKFPKTQYDIKRVDEYVYLYLRPDKTLEELEYEKQQNETQKIKNKYKQEIANQLNISIEQADKIIGWLSYPKEYYEKHKNKNPKTYNNSFRVYYKYGSPSNIEFNTAKEVFDYINTDEFIKSVYHRSNPRNEILISLYGWDSLRIKYDEDGRPFLPNAETDWSKTDNEETDWSNRGRILIVYPFIKTNIKNLDDLKEKLRKTISDFIICYKIYVLDEKYGKKIMVKRKKDESKDFLDDGGYVSPSYYILKFGYTDYGGDEGYEIATSKPILAFSEEEATEKFLDQFDESYEGVEVISISKQMAEGGITDDEGNLIDIKGGGLLMIPNNIADEIKKSISMGYDIIREGLISPKRKGIMLSNEDYKVRGTYPSELKNAIQQMIDNSKMKKGGTLEGGVKKNMLFDKNGERRVDPEALAYIENTVEMLPQTKFMHTKENGQYTPERKKLHDEIIATFHEGKPCIEQRPAVAILTGGAPASGKTTFIKKYVDLDPDKVYHVDADEVRAMLPEYKGYNATQTHLETADMVNQLIDEIGVPCDHDLIYDGTMNKATKYEKIVEKLHKLGYKVFVVYISIPEQVSKERVISRYKKAGRYVPMKVIEEVYDNGLKAFEKVAYEMADGYIRIDGMNGEIIEQGGISMPSNIEYDKGGEIADNKLKNGTALVRSAERYAEAQTGEAVDKGKGMARAFKLDGKMAYNSVIVFFKNGEHIIYDEDEFPKFFMKDGGELGGQDYYDGFQMQVVQKKGNPDKEVQKENIKMSYRKGGKL